jgi:hypothetical protein
MSQNNQDIAPVTESEDDYDEVTHYRVFDATWYYDTKANAFSDDWNDAENFDTLEEALEEYHRRCEEHDADENFEVDAVYLEEMGGGEDDEHQIDTIKYWSRMTIDEFTTQQMKPWLAVPDRDR